MAIAGGIFDAALGVAGLDRFWKVAFETEDGVPDAPAPVLVKPGGRGQGAGNCPGIGFQLFFRPSL